MNKRRRVAYQVRLFRLVSKDKRRGKIPNPLTRPFAWWLVKDVFNEEIPFRPYPD